jgi:hypothetical protein
MTGATELAGFQRLIEVCRRHELPLETQPAEGGVPKPGELFLGQPFDPVLARVYGKVSRALLGDVELYSCREVQNPLLSVNERMRWGETEPYRSVLLFGKIPGLAYHFATVPPLADSRGIQPVIFIDGYEGNQVLPVASNVDEFFMTFSMYLEQLVVTPDYLAERHVSLHFPTSVPELIARDRPLVEAVVAGRFNPLLGNDAESLEWVSKVIGAAQ